MTVDDGHAPGQSFDLPGNGEANARFRREPGRDEDDRRNSRGKNAHNQPDTLHSEPRSLLDPARPAGATKAAPDASRSAGDYIWRPIMVKQRPLKRSRPRGRK